MQQGGSRDALREPIARGVLLRYRVMAFTTAVLLIVLVFVGIPLQVAAHTPGVVNVVGTLHGFLYIVYLVTAFSLTRRLGVPKWQMLLVLLAGTVPFCAFVAERRLTHRFEAQAGCTREDGVDAARSPQGEAAGELRRRWLSGRALVLHAEVLVVAPGCFAAGWWQATRALAGNELSWVYSVEWPIFALLAIAGWWHLVHEDPEAYRARRWRRQAPGVQLDASGADPLAESPSAGSAAISTVSIDVEAPTIRWAKWLAAGVAVDFVLGIIALAVIPFSRPSGWLPTSGAAVYGVHATVGLLVGFGAAAFLARALDGGRIARVVGWTGAVCLGLAGLGGLLTEGASSMRFVGICLMFVFSVLAGCAYLIPAAIQSRQRGALAATNAAGAGEAMTGSVSSPG